MSDEITDYDPTAMTMSIALLGADVSRPHRWLGWIDGWMDGWATTDRFALHNTICVMLSGVERGGTNAAPPIELK